MSTPPTPVEFGALDGTPLVGDLAVPDTPTAASIVCHPHPLYGGDRFDHVVTALFGALPRAGVAALRFDFRQDFAGGAGEVLDARAAIEVLAEKVPGVPLVAVGYSFGAMIALALDDARLEALVLVAPPLTMTSEPVTPNAPTLVVTPEHDQLCPPSATEPIVDEWSAAGATVDRTIVEMTDHSLVGRTTAVTDEVAGWLRRRLPPPSPPSRRR